MHEQGFVVGISHHLLNAELDVVSYCCERKREVKFQNYFPDAESLDAGNGGLIRTKYHSALLALQGRSLTETIGKFYTCVVYNLVIPVLQVDIDEASERRVAEGTTFLYQIAEITREIVVHNLLDDGQFGIVGLKNNLALLAFSSCTACHLCYHHIGCFPCSEIGKVEHGISREDADYANVVEVEPLGHHLSTNKKVGLLGREIAYDTLVGVSGSCGVKVHSCDTSLGKIFAYYVLDFLSSEASVLKFRVVAVGAFGRHSIGVATIVTGERVEVLVVG